MEDYSHLLSRMLFQVTGQELSVTNVLMQSGGCINMSVKAVTDQGDFFVKWNELEYADMFEKEARGLRLLGKTDTVKVPEVLGYGQVEEKAFLVLEFLEKGRGYAEYWEDLGEGLAALHLHQQPEYGLDHANYIGKLHQDNGKEASWLTFFKEHRLNHQLGLAIYNGFVDEGFVRDMKTFFTKLPNLLPDSPASLLHGDLWNGNIMSVSTGRAAFFDPAVYYGAREMDLAMTRLFGGFDQRFYEAYHAVYPIPGSFEALVDVYNLYPLMVHVNLFGPNSGYSGSVRRIISRYL